jgi:magnesium chelatase subunit D
MSERRPVPGKSKERRPSRDAVRPPRVPPPVYPFTAIVGQDEMKLALLLNVIDASIGGVLIMGHRGTGKSTAVRALADLLPQIHRVRDCFYGCDPADETNLCDDCYARLSSEGKLAREKASVPVAELPLGATEDRICGTVNIERALKEGVKAFEPGLLARANRGFLYIDEVNLLEDHLIDLLLDVAVTGRNLVEREGLSVEHPASFRLIGSGNPEEGELRPQLLDRFGLHVEVRTATDLDERVLIVERRQSFERDPAGFCEQAKSEQEALRRRLVRAGKKVHGVKLSRELLRQIAGLCGQLRIDGHRGELSIARAARALAAFEGRGSVTTTDVRRVAVLALRHRLRRDPLEQTGSSAHIEQHLDKLFPPGDDVMESEARKDAPDEPEPPAPSSSGGRGGNGAGGGGRGRAGSGADGARSGNAPSDDTQHASPPALDAELPEALSGAVPRVEGERTGKSTAARRRAGVRLKSVEARRGRYVRAVSARTSGAKIALDATLRASAIAVGKLDSEMRAGGDSIAGSERPGVLNVSRSLRYKRFKQKEGTLFIFAIDASGSMALNRIAQAKGALVRLLRQSYIKRDRVALISFRGAGADVMLRPTGSAERAKRILDALGVGGATPLAAGLSCALEVARQSRRQGAGRIVLLLFTDGRANRTLLSGDRRSGNAGRGRIEDELKLVGAALGQMSVQTIVVDTQNRFTSGGEAQKLAETIGGRYVYLPSTWSTGEGFLSLDRQARQNIR